MAIFPELVGAMKSFAAGFSNTHAEIDWKAITDAAPPLEYKSVDVQTGWFGTGSWNSGSIGGSGLRRFNTATSGWASEIVTLDTAQNLSTLHACRRIICETFAGLPCDLIEQANPDATLKKRYDLPIYQFLRHGNDERGWFGFAETATAHMLLLGNAYARIIRRSGGDRTALDLELLLPDWVTPQREHGYGRLMYAVQQPGRPRETYYVTPGEPHDILHLRGYGYDGLQGYSLLTLARQTLSTGLGLEKNWGRFLANGGRVPYIITKDQPFTNQGLRDDFRTKWAERYADPHVPVLLEGAGTKYQQIGISAKDAQFLESRDFNTLELCRWLGVSPTLVYDLRYGKESIEELARSFINFTERGWIDRWQSDFFRCVLTPAEKRAGLGIRHDLGEIEKPNFQERFAGYTQGLVNGVFNRNEVRGKEGMQPVKGLDGYTVQVQNVDATAIAKRTANDAAQTGTAK